MTIIALSSLIANLNLSLNKVHNSNENLIFPCEISVFPVPQRQTKHSQSLHRVDREFLSLQEKVEDNFFKASVF